MSREHICARCALARFPRGLPPNICTSVNPCIHIHGAKQSRVQWLRAQCSRAQHLRIMISNSSLEQPLRAHRRPEAGSNSLFGRTGGTGQARTAFSNAFWALLHLFALFCAFLSHLERKWRRHLEGPRTPLRTRTLV